MNLPINTIILKKQFLFFTLLMCGIFNAQSQTPTLEVVYESSEEIFNPIYTEGYIHWEVYSDDPFQAYQLYNGTISSSTLPDIYALCMSQDGSYKYRDFAYFSYSNPPGINYCSGGFLWSEGTFIEAPQDIGTPCTGYENYVFANELLLIFYIL